MDKKYFIRVKKTLVEVDQDIYKTYYRMERRERFLVEKDCMRGTQHYADLDIDGISGEETIADQNLDMIDKIVEIKLMSGKLHDCLALLAEDEKRLIVELFFNNNSERKVADKLEISQTTLNYRKRTILAKLKKLLEK